MDLATMALADLYLTQIYKYGADIYYIIHFLIHAAFSIHLSSWRDIGKKGCIYNVIWRILCGVMSMVDLYRHGTRGQWSMEQERWDGHGLLQLYTNYAYEHAQLPSQCIYIPLATSYTYYRYYDKINYIIFGPPLSALSSSVSVFWTLLKALNGNL